MRISTKGTYALEIIVDLAMHSSEEHLERLKILQHGEVCLKSI